MRFDEFLPTGPSALLSVAILFFPYQMAWAGELGALVSLPDVVSSLRSNGTVLPACSPTCLPKPVALLLAEEWGWEDYLAALEAQLSQHEACDDLEVFIRSRIEFRLRERAARRLAQLGCAAASGSMVSLLRSSGSAERFFASFDLFLKFPWREGSPQFLEGFEYLHKILNGPFGWAKNPKESILLPTYEVASRVLETHQILGLGETRKVAVAQGAIDEFERLERQILARSR